MKIMVHQQGMEASKAEEEVEEDVTVEDVGKSYVTTARKQEISWGIVIVLLPLLASIVDILNM